MTRYLVRARFRWPWGQPGEAELGPFDRALAEIVLLSCADAPLAVVGAAPDDPGRGREHSVRVERARIVEVTP